MTRRFLGWDCANRTLGWSYFDLDTEILPKLMSLALALRDVMRAPNQATAPRVDYSRELAILKEMTAVTDGFIRFISCGVKDILGCKINECDDVTKTARLCEFLREGELWNVPDTYVIIERQPPKIGRNTNRASSAVSHQLAYHYISQRTTEVRSGDLRHGGTASTLGMVGTTGASVIFVDPKLKNTLTLAPGMSLADYVSKYAIRYTARKQHSKENFLMLIRVFGLDAILVGVPKSVQDDLADSFMQVLAWCVTSGIFV